MILKFVYGKQIHIYDLKQEESYNQVCNKIKLMFKRLPEHFILTFRNSQQLELQIDTNEQFNQLINDFQGHSKTIKLYITDLNHRKLVSSQEKSEEKIPELNEEKQVQDLPEDTETYKIGEESGKFTHLQEPQQETQNLLQFQQEHNQQTNEKNQQFQHLNSSDQDQNEVQKEVENYLKNKIQSLAVENERQIETNILELSNPHEIENLKENEYQKKENFNNQSEIKHQNVQNIDLISNVYEENQLFSHQENKNSEPQMILPNPERKKIFQPYEPMKKAESKNIRQHQAKCNLCECYPIIGTRYKCVVCQDYDMCQNCESKYEHQHPILKISYANQTPISIKVEIPQFKEEKKEPVIVLQRQEISDLNEQQRRQRIFSLASELSELLDIQFQFCVKFIRQNQQYTKQTLTQLLISRKNNALLEEKGAQKEKKTVSGFSVTGVLGNLKDTFKGFISSK